jgi:hypothetical protein
VRSLPNANIRLNDSDHPYQARDSRAQTINGRSALSNADVRRGSRTRRLSSAQLDHEEQEELSIRRAQTTSSSES